MPNLPDFDPQTDLTGVPAPASLLSSDQELLAGIRVTRAQFARMMGCSRQAVTEWVRAGRLTVGPDGRFDPRQAVASLLRTGDPARLRARVLQPLALELQTYRARIVDLEAALGQAMRTNEIQRAQLAERASAAESEDLEFYKDNVDELFAIFHGIQGELPTCWHELKALPGDAGAIVIIGWLNRAIERTAAGAGPMLPREVVEGEEGEECGVTFVRQIAPAQSGK